MNENINLVEILKDCPNGTKLYSTLFGEVEYVGIAKESGFPITFRTINNTTNGVTSEGTHFDCYDGECTLFPSKEQRDWSKFKVKKPKFDPKTLQPFDKVLVRDSSAYTWRCAFYSHTKEKEDRFKYVTGSSEYEFCIPYNDDTKHLVGTTEEAPSYYRFWED